MRSSIRYALTSASLFSLAIAAPAELKARSSNCKPSASSGASMVATPPAKSTVVPFVNDGFPDFTNAQLKSVEVIAHGTEPNGAPPSKISDQGVINLQLIEYNENSEVAFFSSLLHNLTTGVKGYEIADKAQHDKIVAAITAIVAQEELHAFYARSALSAFGKTTIDPCPSYKFPVATFDDAIGLAKTFTDVVLGTLGDVSVVFAKNGDVSLPGAVASVIGQEGEQVGFFRYLDKMNLIPSALPFLTASTRDLAFSALQGFVNGHCDGTDTLKKTGLKIFGVLNLLTAKIQPNVDQTLTFSFDIASLKNSANLDFPKLFANASRSVDYSSWSSGTAPQLASMDWASSGLYLQYINQQNVPVSEVLKNVRVAGTVVTFDADFPQKTLLMNSLTQAAVTVGKGFADANAVAAAALFAPALIEVN